MPIISLSGTRLALPLRNANYGIYITGSAISLIGTWMQRIAIGWLTWQLTHSGLWLGIVAFADFFPVLIVGPIAGAAADRWDRLRVVQVKSSGFSMAQAAVLFALTASGHMNIGLLVALTAFQGVIVAFNQPARLALVPSLVAQSDLGSAVAINSVIFNLARFIGPMLAGLAIVWLKGWPPPSLRMPSATSHLYLLWSASASSPPLRSCQNDAASTRTCRKASAIPQLTQQSQPFSCC